jgi:hypothetical protein
MFVITERATKYVVLAFNFVSMARSQRLTILSHDKDSLKLLIGAEHMINLNVQLKYSSFVVDSSLYLLSSRPHKWWASDWLRCDVFEECDRLACVVVMIHCRVGQAPIPKHACSC